MVHRLKTQYGLVANEYVTLLLSFIMNDKLDTVYAHNLSDAWAKFDPQILETFAIHGLLFYSWVYDAGMGITALI